MTRNVVALNGNIIPGEANPDIVDELERLLDEAKRGDLHAFAYCTVSGDIKGTGWVGNQRTQDALAAGIALLGWRYTAETMIEAEE